MMTGHGRPKRPSPSTRALSLDDKYLYVACWGLGEMHQYDVSDPMNPKLAGKVELGGIARGAKHPCGKDFVFGPQMVEIHGMINSIPAKRAARWSWRMWGRTAG